ncbi:single-pass membrane and coiled-coil domain-containing protein 3-like [Platysternon megacephalum]|uniref:Single-pass membrane and coiled-coil domain-containing protein 3-like n=1 Tax=Platysternon megacephalum TaxID=55544 RepID=A0A4D9DKS2_9SAUR|nr:single-pass membrane and coiled-coil domain-containing protein 3-like [Platysternon megacephalum]
MAGLSVRSVLVTGSNRGIGLELVKQLLGKSNPPQWIFATCRDPEGARGQELQNLVSKHPNLMMVKLDAVNPASIEEATRRVEEQLDGSGLNLVINNAGIFSNVSLATVDSEEMLSAYKTNVVGPMLVGQAFLPLLKKAAQGSSQKGLSCSKAAIVNISSVLGSIERIPETFFKPVVSYRCSKAALNMLTRCQALSYAEDGILCAAVHPGWVQTDMGTQEADLPVDESVRGILAVLPTLSEKHSRSLWSWAGKTIPW